MPNFISVNQLIKKQTAFTLGSLRQIIFHEHTNGLAKTGAIIRIGRKVIIDEEKFLGWVESHKQEGNQ